jgi:DNA-binding response OmpR family regulator
LLIVEDDAATRFALAKILTYSGYEVSTAATLASALVKCEDHTCVLLDLHLPDGLGLEVLRRLREKGGGINIAICSAAYDPELRQRVEHYRPDAVFIKPIDLDALMDWIKRVCQMDCAARNQAPAKHTTDSLDAPSAPPPSL